VQGRFGTALLLVVKIEPEHTRPFEEVADQLKQTLATERAKSEMLSVYDKLEDERSQGKTLAEGAEKLKLAVRTLEVDRNGLDPAGSPATMSCSRLTPASQVTRPVLVSRSMIRFSRAVEITTPPAHWAALL